MKHPNLILDPLHFIIRFNHGLGGAEEFGTDIIVAWEVFNSLLIAKLVLQGSPKIHSVGTDLKFYPHRRFALGKEYGNFHDHVIAAVAVRLGIFDIVLDLENFNIILSCDCLLYTSDAADE